MSSPFRRVSLQLNLARSPIVSGFHACTVILRPHRCADEEWLRFTTTQAVETEINIQLGEFTLKKQQMQLLGGRVYNFPDFEDVFGSVARENGMQCAIVQHTTNREWLRTGPGLMYDVLLWTADDRQIPNPFRRKFPGGLSKDENWVAEILGPWMQSYHKTAKICAQPDDSSSGQFMRLCGRLLGVKEEPLREIIVIRSPPTIHVYNVIEHGRRWYQQLVFTSVDSACLHDMSTKKASASAGTNYDSSSVASAAGSVDNFSDSFASQVFDGSACTWHCECQRALRLGLQLHGRLLQSLVITRNISLELGVQVFLDTVVWPRPVLATHPRPHDQSSLNSAAVPADVHPSAARPWTRPGLSA